MKQRFFKTKFFANIDWIWLNKTWCKYLQGLKCQKLAIQDESRDKIELGWNLITIPENSKYRISENTFRRNYSSLNLEIVENSNSYRKFQFFYLINWIFAAETIQGRKLFKGRKYSWNYSKLFQQDVVDKFLQKQQHNLLILYSLQLHNWSHANYKP